MKLEMITERLRLTPLSPEDAEIWVTLRSDPEVMKYIGPARDKEHLLEILPKRCLRGGGGAIGFWCVSVRETGERIGTAPLLPLPVEDDDSKWERLEEETFPEEDIELGYTLKPAAWGKGYATEIALALQRFVFEETPLQKVVGVTHPDNLVSQHILRKVGMRYTGLRRAYALDLPGFEMTREEWLARQAAYRA
ncbi:MAG: GNAT family N-acetyltransferase [Pseudomonadota bacterium]